MSFVMNVNAQNEPQLYFTDNILEYAMEGINGTYVADSLQSIYFKGNMTSLEKVEMVMKLSKLDIFKQDQKFQQMFKYVKKVDVYNINGYYGILLK